MGVQTESEERLNVEYNLVPFIDLLSSLVLFLLITAVWIQVSAITTGVDKQQAQPVVSATTPNLLLVHLTPEHITLQWPATVPNAGALPQTVAKASSRYDWAELERVVSTAVKWGASPTAAVSADDRVDYGGVIEAIDTLKSAGLTNVGLATD